MWQIISFTSHNRSHSHVIYIINSDKENEANQSEMGPSQPKKKSGAKQSESEDSQAKKNVGKNEDAMDVAVHTGVGREGISSAVNIGSETQADVHPPPVESVASTSDGRTSRTAAEVQAFSGMGRTLGESG